MAPDHPSKQRSPRGRARKSKIRKGKLGTIRRIAFYCLLVFFGFAFVALFYLGGAFVH
jgi:hypothetical protein